MWTYEYDDTGGYDCMTGAFWIHHTTQRCVLCVDLASYGQPACGIEEPARRLAEPFAQAVVAALNAAGTLPPVRRP